MSDVAPKLDPLSDAAFARMRARQRALDIDYWRSIHPDGSITDDPFVGTGAPYPAPAEGMDDHLLQLRTEGYFQTSPVVDEADMARLRAAILRVRQHGHRATYALLYDDFYRVAARLQNILTPVLGPGYQMVPDEPEAYLIANDGVAAGAGPHRDSLRAPSSVLPDGTPTLVNLWVPLTDATPLSSCMYVVPAHRDPGYPRSGAAPPAQEDGAAAVARVDVQDIRALPARAGSVLGWSTHLLHWGARGSGRAPEPRMSFSFYFQSRAVPAFHRATMDLPSPLPFAYRLYLVEKVWRDPLGRSGEFRHLQKYAEGRP